MDQDSQGQTDLEPIYRAISQYPFDQDPEYQAGLAAILGHPETPATKEEIEQQRQFVLGAKCFYFIRRFNVPISIDPAAYSTWLSSQQTQPVQHQDQPYQQPTEASQTQHSPLTKSQGLTKPPPVTSPATTEQAQSSSLQERTSAGPSSQLLPPASDSGIAASPPPTSTSSPPSAAQPTSPPTTNEQPQYPTSFAAIVDLITQNIPVPGIEDIPTTVLEPGSSRVDKTPRRRKPWEKKDGNNDDGPDHGRVGDSAMVASGEKRPVSVHEDGPATTSTVTVAAAAGAEAAAAADTWSTIPQISSDTTGGEGVLSTARSSGDDHRGDGTSQVGIHDSARSIEEDGAQTKAYTHDMLSETGGGSDTGTGKLNDQPKSGQGVVNILKPNAIPDSGLLARD